MFEKFRQDLKAAQEAKKNEIANEKLIQKEKFEREKQYFDERLKEKTLLEIKVQYGGGHPECAETSKGKLTINKLGLYFGGLTHVNFKIPIELILKAEYKTEDQLRTDAALARYELFGIFSAGMSSKRSFLLLTYNESGMENKIIFESQEAPGIVSAIMEARQAYVKAHPAPNSSTGIDIPEQIKKLSELKEQGILSQEEFDTKKTELLSRI